LHGLFNRLLQAGQIDSVEWNNTQLSQAGFFPLDKKKPVHGVADFQRRRVLRGA
jgi:hypothetical protein